MNNELTILTVVVLGALYFLHKKKNCTPKGIEKFPISTDEKKQDVRNCEFVNTIISGHHSYVTRNTTRKARLSFEKWQQKQKQLFQKASPEVLKLRAKYLRKNTRNIFNYTYTNENPHLNPLFQTKNIILYTKDVFTEPFPSTHDMSEWAITNQLNDIFLLSGITPEHSSEFLIHEKNHFVNHTMVKGIIQFDIYRITTKTSL